MEESLDSLKHLNPLEPLENGQILLCFPHAGDRPHLPIPKEFGLAGVAERLLAP